MTPGSSRPRSQKKTSPHARPESHAPRPPRAAQRAPRAHPGRNHILMTDGHTPGTMTAADGTVPPQAPSRSRRRLIVTTTLVVLVVATGIAALLLRGTPERAPTDQAAAPISTVPVTTGDMVSTINAKATLHHSQEGTLVASSAGVVTALPAVGTVISPGTQLYRINDLPVVLLRGPLPAWRVFEMGMTPGEDVRQLEQNLTDLGLFRGKIDGTFTQATADSISAWQKALGVERTGKLDRSALVFSDHDLRIAQMTTMLGTDVASGTELFRTSSTDKIVDLDLRLADQQLAAPGAEVRIALPDGTATTGSIASVGDPVERDAAGEDTVSTDTAGTFVIPVSVTVADQAAVAAFPRASVTVQFASTLASDALTVPVEALVATDATSFAVQVPSDGPDDEVRKVPVTVGAFASGQVQISGQGIREGLDVVVPAS
jgi:peptidoglycan hydrolase-like protein with peptidoglycan-binding domain